MFLLLRALTVVMNFVRHGIKQWALIGRQNAPWCVGGGGGLHRLGPKLLRLGMKGLDGLLVNAMGSHVLIRFIEYPYIHLFINLYLLNEVLSKQTIAH